MTKTFRNTLARIIASMTLVLLPMIPVTVHADAQTTITQSVNCGTQLQVSDTGCGGQQDTSSNIAAILTDIINIFSVIVGAVAVIMIIVGGFKYITSGGESSNVSGAKSTIVYAIVGLVIVVLAQVIVRFVLSKSISAASGS